MNDEETHQQFMKLFEGRDMTGVTYKNPPDNSWYFFFIGVLVIALMLIPAFIAYHTVDAKLTCREHQSKETCIHELGE